MRKESSYGFVPLKREKHQWHVLLVHRLEGFWEFPKGHPDKGETPLEAAKREMQEEAGVQLERLLSEEPLSIHYWFTWKGEKIEKSVHYFVGLVSGKARPQLKEMQNVRWVLLEDAPALLTHENNKNICRQVQKLLKEQDQDAQDKDS
jgi:8-oxo-dGTP pyrophosphatase MutT (NUDIX family)